MYKKALHSFFLRVHPDFFAAHRTAQLTNEKSIAELNELLGWAREFKTGTLRPPPVSTLQLTFFSQHASALDGVQSPAPTSSGKKQVSDASTLVQISSRFELPSTFTPTDANRGVAERAVNKFLRELLRKAGCIDHATEAQSVADDAEAETIEVKPLRRKQHDTVRRKAAQKTKSLLDEASESLADGWSVPVAPTPEELMESDQILFSRALSPLQSASALQTLQHCLSDMLYERWAMMPLIVCDTFAIGEITGALSVPWDFTLPQFIAFLHHNAAKITECQQAAVEFAERVETLVSIVCKELDMDDILISCSHRDAMPVLELLRHQCPLLRSSDITGVSLEISNGFGYRDNGVLIIDKAATPESMHRAIKAFGPRMGHQRSLYRLAKEMLESSQWHLQQFRENVRPQRVDLFVGNDATYAERLQWIKELFRVSPTLAQWDWSDMAFVLGPLDIDWQNKIVSLPANVDGDSFVRYIEEVHKKAKDDKRDQRLKDAALERSVAQSTAEANEGGFLEGPGKRDRVVSISGLDESEQVAERLADRGQLVADQRLQAEVLEQQRREAQKEWLRKTSPHLEEYLTSDPKGGDQLSVERPLYHNYDFEADDHAGEVAQDNMAWEGAFDNPFVDMVPQRDIDDVAAAYMQTQRKHREEAVKKMVRELQDRTGNGQLDRNRGIKLGDLTGLNNTKLKPRGFPILAKGTHRGAKEVDTRPY